MKGICYGVGVGPGDPELMTLKAVRLIRENEVIAVPGKEPRESVAYQIAVRAVPELSGKELVPLHMPMSRERNTLREAHRRGAEKLMRYLDRGKNVVYLALGDPTVYCTFSYLQHILESEGYPVELVSGVPSFCAAAARCNTPLAEWDEALHILPALHETEGALEQAGTCVLMKSASHMKDVKELLRRSGRGAMAVLQCGMSGERLCHSLEEIPDEAGYFSLIISKETRS